MQTAATSAAAGADQRRERRVRTLKGGRIIFNEGTSVFNCLVRNQSPSGAMIEVPNMLGIPSRFDFLLDHTVNRRPCTVRWHTDRLMGVLFDDAVFAAH